jgi:hypothetical protein
MKARWQFVDVAGIPPHPDSSRMAQVVRNITDVNDGFLRVYGGTARNWRYFTASTRLIMPGSRVRVPPFPPSYKPLILRYISRAIPGRLGNRIGAFVSNFSKFDEISGFSRLRALGNKGTAGATPWGHPTRICSLRGNMPKLPMKLS